MASRLGFVGIIGGPAIYFITRYTKPINRILRQHSPTFPTYDGESYDVFYQFGGDIDAGIDKIGPARYYQKKRVLTCGLNVSYGKILSLNDTLIQRFLADSLSECFKLMKLRMMKAHNDFDHCAFQSAVDCILAEFLAELIPNTESDLELNYRTEILPVIEAMYKERHKAGLDASGPKVSDIVDGDRCPKELPPLE